MLVLVLNTGSSSVKYELIDPTTGERRGGGIVEEVADHDAALAEVVAGLGSFAVDAVGHRVVHGGEAFSAPTVVDDGVLATLRSLVPLAPLHNPANITGLEVGRRVWPDVPHVAVFDTAFHRTLPDHAYRYAVPSEWYERHGVRRYGFHGTSHEYVAGRAADVLGTERFDGIVAHLGNGASITAIAGGRSVDTSMGLSPLEGLVMGTRSGDVDPTVITHVAAATGRPIEDVFKDLNRASGLRGLCGASDMREITARADSGEEAARLAIAVFAYRIKKYVGAYLAVLGGRCDALVFTGGIGEHSAVVRAAVCDRLEGLGIVLDAERNSGSDEVISTDDSPITILVIATDEELEIARETAALCQHELAQAEAHDEQ
jgi:acetate kinase